VKRQSDLPALHFEMGHRRGRVAYGNTTKMSDQHFGAYLGSIQKRILRCAFLKILTAPDTFMLRIP